MRSIDWDSLAAYTREVRNASRSTPEPSADGSMPEVEPSRARAFRARASHLDRRLPAGSFAQAARGGLQDSAPRDALLALHARVADVRPDSWEDPSLVQVWFRWADYVVPREDVAVFTLGSFPRNPTYASAISGLADAIVDALGGEERVPSEVADSIPGIPTHLLIRAANVAGRFHIRWDARRVTVRQAPDPMTHDPEQARLELARRYLRWLGPSNARRFARWAGVTRSDAEATWSALADELAPVAVGGRARWILADDLVELLDGEPEAGTRFLAQGDPYLTRDPLVAHTDEPVERPGVPRRLLNSLTGRILVDGSIVGSWGRRQHHLTIALWRGQPASARDRIVHEAESLSGPIGKPMRVRWLE